MNRRTFSLMGLGTAAAALQSSSSAQTRRVPSPSNLEEGVQNKGTCLNIRHCTPSSSRPKAMSKVKTRPLWYILDGRRPLTGDQSHAVLYTVKTRGSGCKSCAAETTI